MAFWNRRKETLPARVEQRYGIDPWISDYLLPASWQSFMYNGVQYPITGLNQTLAGNRAVEVSQTLPGYTQALRRCPPAFAAQMIRALVLSQARFTFRARPYGPASTARRLFGTNELLTLEEPWPNGTSGELISRMEWHAGLAGNSYVTNYSQDGRLRVLRPDWVKILYGSQREPDDPALALDGEVVSYIYTNGGLSSGYTPQFLPPVSVAHWSPLPDPETAGLGMSWITPAVRDIMSDALMTDHKIKFFEQGATPNLVVRGLQAQDQGEFNRLVDMMETAHAGLRNAYKTLYLTAGADATVVGANLQQIDFKSTQGSGETRIAMLSRVHPVILGASEGLAGSSLNAGNFAMARRIWGDTWIYPTLQDLCRALAPLLTVPANAELWFDVVDMPVLREDAKDAAEIIQIKASTIEALVKEGFTPKSSIAAVEGQNMNLLEHTGLVSVQLQPPGMAMPGTPADTSAPPVPGQQGNPPPNGRAPVPTANGNPARALRYSEDQPRDDHGKWSSDGGGGDGSASPKADVSHIADKLSQGQTASVDPGEMDSLMKDLASKPPMNLAKLQVNGKGNENLFTEHARDIPREQMPQLPKNVAGLADFSAKLAENGLSAKVVDVDPRTLSMTQNQLDSATVGRLYKEIQTSGWRANGVIVTSKDGEVLDGHHRWAAAAAASVAGNALKIHTFQVDAPIDKLLSLANEVSLPRLAFGARARTITFGEQPSTPPPNKDEPWLWADGQWWLVATDTADDVPASLAHIEQRSLRFDENQPRDEHGRWTSGGGGGETKPSAPSGGRDAKAVAADLAAQAKAAEPKLTQMVKDFSAQHGGKPVGLDFRLKTEARLAEKIQGDTRPVAEGGKGLDAEGAGAKIYDAVRYTTIFPEDDSKYAQGAQGMLTDLRGQGYEMKVKNFWNDDLGDSKNPYRGINAQITSPDGQQFEWQLHTQHSFDIKNDTSPNGQHGLYAQSRTLPVDDPRQAELVDKMFAITQGLSVPPNITTVRQRQPGLTSERRLR